MKEINLNLAVKKLLKIKEVAGVFFPSEGGGLPVVRIAERIYKDAATGKIKRCPEAVYLEVEIVMRGKKANKAVKVKIAKIMGNIPYKIAYKI